MEVTRRPLHEDEHAGVRDWLARRRPHRLDDWMIGLVAPFALVFVPLLVLGTIWPSLRAIELPLLFVLMAAGALLAFRMRRRRDLRQGTEALVAEDLRGGEAEVARFEIERAHRVSGEGPYPAFLLEVGGDRLLYLEGAYLERPVAEGAFPSREVETVRLPLSRRLLAFRPRGGALPASRVDDASPLAGDDEPPRDGDILLPGEEPADDPP